MSILKNSKTKESPWLHCENQMTLSYHLIYWGNFCHKSQHFMILKKLKYFSGECLCQTFYSHYLPWYLVSFKWIFFMWTFLIIIEPHLSFSRWILVLIHVRWFMKSCCFFVNGRILHSLPLKYLNIWKYTLLASYIWSVFLEKFYLICVKYLQCIESIINFAYFCCVWK